MTQVHKSKKYIFLVCLFSQMSQYILQTKRQYLKNLVIFRL